MSCSIAIVVSTFPPYPAGMGNVAAAQAKALAERGWDVTVLTPGQMNLEVDKAWPFKVQRLQPILKYGNAAWLGNLRSTLRAYDVVIFHYPFFGGVERLPQSLSPNQALLVYYHMDAVGRGLWKLIFKIHRLIFLRQLLTRADKILVSSASYGRTSFLTRYLTGISHKIIELPIAVNIERFKPGPKPPELLKRHRLDLANNVCLFVGALDSAHYFKGLPSLLNAWVKIKKINPAARLLIIGDGNLRANYVATARQLNILDSVGFLGRVSEVELPDYYRLGDLLILPSIDRSEAFGLVILEAMASGRAVVASSLPGVSSLVRPDETGYLIKPGSEQEIVTVVNLLLQDNTKRDYFGSVARQVAESKYSESVIAERLVKIIDQVKGR